jgi:hypothetical protein
LLAQLHDRGRGEQLAVRRHAELGLRRHRRFLAGVGKPEAGRPDQILVGHHADRDSGEVAIQYLTLEPGTEQPLRARNVRVAGEARRCR